MVVNINDMRTPLQSPFSHGSDNVPAVWAGRTVQLSDWRDVLRPRRLAGIAERGRTVLGEAGTGKSTLVRRIVLEAEEQGDWITPQLRIPNGADPFKHLASTLLDLAERAGIAASREARIKKLLERVAAVSLSGMSLSLREVEGDEPYRVLTDLLVELGRAAMKQRVMVLVHLDEVQNIDSPAVLSQLLVALGDALAHEVLVDAPGGMSLRRTLPIAVYLTGLPEFADLAGARSGATFSRRFHNTVLTAIDDSDFALALNPFVTEGWEVVDEGGAHRVYMEQGAADEIIRLACGEPFLFQLAGAGAWMAGVDDVITVEDVRRGWAQRHAEAETHVARILDRLPEKERIFLEEMAALPPEERSLARIAHAMGYERGSDVGTIARRLDITRGIIRRGTVYDFRHRAVAAALASCWPRL